MSIIDSTVLPTTPDTSDIEDGSDAAAFESAFRFEAEDEITQSALAVFRSKFTFEAFDIFDNAEVGDFASSFQFEATDYFNNEPNILEDADFRFKLEFEAIDTTNNDQELGDFRSNLVFEAIDHFVPAPEYKLSVNLTVLPAAQTNNNIRVWMPRLLVDGTEVPIISWNAPEGESNVGRKLSVVLQRWTDKDLFTADAVIDFGIGKLVAGVWDAGSFITLIESGSFQISSHTISGTPNAAEDRVSIDLVGNLTTRLGTRPQQAIVVYDNHRITQDESFYQTQYDQLGNAYSTALHQIAGLTLHQLMTYVFVTKCGFASIATNLPNYSIVQTYFALGDRFYDGIKKFLGVFNPIIYQDGEIIGIMDATLLQPTGFPDAEIVEVDRITNLSVSDDRTNKAITAIRIQFIHNVEDYDNISERTDPPFTIPEGDNVITVNRTWRTYRKSSEPFINAREELVSEIREKRNASNVLIERSTELFTFGANGDVESRKQTIEGLYPDLANWVGKPETEPPYIFGETVKEVETFEYKSYPIDSLDGSDQRTYISSRSVRRTGTVIVNATDKHLGKPFRQEIQVGTRSGNITEDVTTEANVLIKTTLETGEPIPGGLVNYTNLATDYLPAKPQPYINYSQKRPGDIAAREFVINQRTLIIRPDGTDPIEGIEDFNFGPLPIETAIPLAKRFINAAARSPRTISAPYIGYDESLAPGQVRRLALRDGSIIGTFIILGRTLSGDSSGTFMQLTCREV